MRRAKWLILLAALGVAHTGTATAATYKHCAPVRNPYPDTRYEGVNLSHIRALHTSCRTARRVARKAHRKALAIGVSQGPILHFTWHGWRVRGDLRPDNDRYTARKGDRRVRWRF
jgi:hypothetical protein